MSNIPWPKRGDKAFQFEDNVHQNAFFRRAYMYHSLPAAYSDAADIIIDAADDTKRVDFPDYLLFPVAYLYRHALELHLKRIVTYGISLGYYNKANVEGLLKEHRLLQLWRTAKSTITKYWPDGNIEDVDAVEAVVTEMHQADCNGQKWRYHTNANNQPNTYESLPDYICLKKLRQTMTNVFYFLDACADGIDYGLQNGGDAP
jgi:hypothetical protein